MLASTSAVACYLVVCRIRVKPLLAGYRVAGLAGLLGVGVSESARMVGESYEEGRLVFGSTVITL